MRYGPDDELYVVVDPTSDSEMGDILFTASLRGLYLQFKGGLDMSRNPTIFTDQREAEVEAYARLLGMRVSKFIAHWGSLEDSLEAATHIEVVDAEGTILLEVDLAELKP